MNNIGYFYPFFFFICNTTAIYDRWITYDDNYDSYGPKRANEKLRNCNYYTAGLPHDVT